MIQFFPGNETRIPLSQLAQLGQRPTMQGGAPMPGGAAMQGSPDISGYVDSVRGWIDARPQWHGFDGSRQEFRDARQEWRGQMPQFGVLGRIAQFGAGMREGTVDR